MAKLTQTGDDDRRPKEVRRATAELIATSRPAPAPSLSHDDALIPTTPRDAAQDLNLGPHPYQISRAQRCADRRFPRSPLSVGGEGMRSNSLALTGQEGS
jgi:hypothetical protein